MSSLSTLLRGVGRIKDGKKNAQRIVREQEPSQVESQTTMDANTLRRRHHISAKLGVAGGLEEARLDRMESSILGEQYIQPRRAKRSRTATLQSELPDLIVRWSDLSTCDNYAIMRDAIEEQYNGRPPTPVQMQGISLIRAGHHCVVCAPTGSGKTACYLIPVIDLILSELKSSDKSRRKYPAALIIAPTRELVMQIWRESKSLVDSLKSDLSVLALVDGSNDIKQHGPIIDIMISTPCRIQYMLNENTALFKRLGHLIVDECDKLFDDNVRQSGSSATSVGSFRDQYEAIDASIASLDRKCQRIFLSATLPPVMEEWIHSRLDGLRQSRVATLIVGERNSATSTVDQRLIYAGTELGKLHALKTLIVNGEMMPPVLIFVQSVERAEQLFEELKTVAALNPETLDHSDNRRRYAMIHGQMDRSLRDRAITQFRSGRIWLLICTDLMARGIDFQAINLVINYDFPNSGVVYVHRIGRAGRAGLRGKAVTLFTDEDKPLLRSIAHLINRSDKQSSVPEYLLQSVKAASRKEKRRLAHSTIERKPICLLPKKNSVQKKKIKSIAGK